MIYHLTASGTPISWSIVAIYERSLGIARAAAQAWFEISETPQAIIRIEGGKAECLEMFWIDRDQQQPSDHGMIVSGFHDIADKQTRTQIESLLRGDFVERGWMIPRTDWERRYPASKLMSDRFKEFNAAYDEHKKKGATEEEFFEDRWIMFMDRPEGHVLPYDIDKRDNGFGIKPVRDGETDPTGGHVWPDIEDAKWVCRNLNSGFNWEECQILMTPEPVGEA